MAFEGISSWFEGIFSRLSKSFQKFLQVVRSLSTLRSVLREFESLLREFSRSLWPSSNFGAVFRSFGGFWVFFSSGLGDFRVIFLTFRDC